MLEINKIYLGDCLEVMKDIDDESVDLIVTDPPYLIGYKTNVRKDKQHKFCRTIDNDDKNSEEMIRRYIMECHRIMKNNTAMYMFCSPDRVEIFKLMLQKIFKIKNIIVWVKNNGTMGDLKAQFGKKYEMIFLVNKGRAFFNGKRITDVWEEKRVAGKNQLHQNQKPLRIIELAIEKHSNENEIVFDGFAGSGTTGVACKNLNRRYILIEKDEEYFEIAKRRIDEKFLGSKVVKRRN